MVVKQWFDIYFLTLSGVYTVITDKVFSIQVTDSPNTGNFTCGHTGETARWRGRIWDSFWYLAKLIQFCKV